MKKLLLPGAFALSLLLIASSAYAVSLPNGSAIFETSLVSRISATDTTMTLVTNSANGETVNGFDCFTIDEGRTDAEYVCGIVSGTSVTSLSRGVSYANGTTTSTSRAHIHRTGANVKKTDFPLLQRMRNILNGIETIPNILNYTYSPDYTSASTTAIASKGYVDSVALAGAPDANDNTKGVIQIATGAEAASSTSLGSTGGRLVLGANIATSTCQAAANSVLISSSTTGKLDGNCLNGDYSYLLTGNNVFSGTTTLATTTAASSTVTTLNVGSFVANATASSTAQNLVVTTNASTTNLTISGTCAGCTGKATVTNTASFQTGAGQNTGATATCTGSKVVIGGGFSGVPDEGGTTAAQTLMENYPSANNAWTATFNCGSTGSCGGGTLTVYAMCINP